MNICSTNNVFLHFYSLGTPNTLNFYLKKIRDTVINFEFEFNWIRPSRRYVLNIFTCNNAYADVFLTDF